jgi:hypothetical protein
MKHILEYHKFNSNYKVISYKDNFDDPSGTEFDVVIETPDGSKTIYINYEVFLDYIQEIDSNLKSYLVNRQELNDFESIFGNLEELGFDCKDYLQKWIDDNQEGIEEYLSDEDFDEDSDGYDEDDIDDAPRWWEHDDDDDDDE